MPIPSSDLLAVLNRWPRRLAALGCLLLAAASALSARSRPPAQAAPAGVAVVVAARPLSVGAPLVAADLAVARWPRSLVPAGTVPDPARLVGRRLAGAVTRGEPVTAPRLLGADLAAGLPPGEVAVAVTVTDPAAAALVRAGDRIDLIAVPNDVATDPGEEGTAELLARGVGVLAVVPTTADTAEGSGVGLIVSTDQAGALRIATLAARPVLAVRDNRP